MTENLLKNTIQYLEKAARISNLDKRTIEELKKPKRILKSPLRIEMDSGKSKIFWAGELEK